MGIDHGLIGRLENEMMKRTEPRFSTPPTLHDGMAQGEGAPYCNGNDADANFRWYSTIYTAGEYQLYLAIWNTVADTIDLRLTCRRYYDGEVYTTPVNQKSVAVAVEVQKLKLVTDTEWRVSIDELKRPGVIWSIVEKTAVNLASTLYFFSWYWMRTAP